MDSPPVTAPPRSLRAVAFAPLLLVVVVLGVDALLARGPDSLAFMGPVDETGHLATAAVVLLALVPLRTLLARRYEALVAIAGSVLIDVDHIPLYAGVPHVAAGGRPYSHSLATVAVLLALALVLPRRARRWPAALAVGVCLHFVRDIATGPGLLLWWPLSDRTVLLPYGLYAAVLAVLAVVAAVRIWRVS